MSKLCDECETVAHCMKHGCIPKQQALDKKAENARELGLDYEPDGMHHNKPQKRPQNCGTGYCSCIECVMEPAQQEPEMPYTVIAGELDCSHVEELCKKLTETKGCWHTVIGTGQLKQDGSPAAWSCVMCGTSFAPKMSEKSLADLYQVGFNNGRKFAEILSPKKHPQPAQQEPVAWRYLTKYKDQSVWTYCAFKPTSRETWEALYTSPPTQRKPLTDEEIEKLREKTFSTGNPYCPVDSKSMRKAARAIEAAHGIKGKA